jgi:hypothetical protein
MLWGCLTFWFPDSLWHAIRGAAFDGYDVWGLTVLLPCLSALALVGVSRFTSPETPRRSVAFGMIAGILLFGSAFIVYGMEFQSAPSPHAATSASINLILALLGPVSLTMLAAYDGTLGAVVITTIALFAMKDRPLRHRA